MFVDWGKVLPSKRVWFFVDKWKSCLKTQAKCRARQEDEYSCKTNMILLLLLLWRPRVRQLSFVTPQMRKLFSLASCRYINRIYCMFPPINSWAAALTRRVNKDFPVFLLCTFENILLNSAVWGNKSEELLYCMNSLQGLSEMPGFCYIAAPGLCSPICLKTLEKN